MKGKRFVAYFFFISFSDVSLGLHICFDHPNIEVHLPFGFIRIGWVKPYARHFSPAKDRTFGWS